MSSNTQIKPYENPRQMLMDPRFEARIGTVAPPHMDPKRMTRIALSALQKNPKLAQCTPSSLGIALINAAEFGLEPNGWEAHLVPYWNGKARVMEAQFQADYKGLVKLAYQSEMVGDITAEVVRSGDLFQWEKGTESYLRWRPKGSFDPDGLTGDQRACVIHGKDGEMHFVWAMATVQNGGKPFIVMTREDVMRHKAKSQAAGADFSPWNDILGEPEMWKKTALRKLCKTLPRSSALNRLLAMEMAQDLGRNASSGLVATPGPQPQSMGDHMEGMLGLTHDEQSDEPPKQAAKSKGKARSKKKASDEPPPEEQQGESEPEEGPPGEAQLKDWFEHQKRRLRNCKTIMELPQIQSEIRNHDYLKLLPAEQQTELGEACNAAKQRLA